MSFWKCYYHLVWTTKHRQPIITAEREGIIFATIRSVNHELGGEIWALNGTADHVHVAASIPPSIAVAQWVRRCKGASSHAVNQRLPASERFRWQAGYGVLTFGQQALSFVVRYVANQKQHHAENKLYPAMERVKDEY